MLIETINIIKNIVDVTISDISFRKKTEEVIYDYIVNLYNRLSSVKNVIFRTSPIEFYDNFIPLTLKGNKSFLRLTNPTELLEEYNKIVILGSAGCGKTTILKYFALKCIDDKINIPIFIELRHLSINNDDFEKFVLESISLNYSNEISKTFKSGNFLFLLDGFDELDFSSGNKIINQIQLFITKYSSNKFIITSRSGTNLEFISNFFVFEILPLNNQDIELYVQKINITSDLKKKITNSLHGNNVINEIIRNPLFLSIYINSYNNHNSFPSKKSVFLRQVFDALFIEHDSYSKMGYQRHKVSNLKRDNLESIICAIAFLTYFEDSSSFTKDHLLKLLDTLKDKYKLTFENEKVIHDLTITFNILLSDNQSYEFSHILIHEYLASLFISKLEYSSKLKIYSKMIDNTTKVFNSSFYEFLNELDNQIFSLHYLIPMLENIINQNNRLGDKIIFIENDYNALNKNIEIFYFINKVYYKNETIELNDFSKIKIDTLISLIKEQHLIQNNQISDLIDLL